jgi:hypothetical protein
MYQTFRVKFLLTFSVLYVSTIIQPNLIKAQNAPYWQQEVNYTLDVTLDDVNHFLHGFEKIEYINQSPNTIDHIYFHLWPNAYKDQTTAFAKQQIENGHLNFYRSEEKDKGYIDSLDFKVNGKKVDTEYLYKNIDICKLKLDEPLRPGEKIFITTPFRVKIPSSFSRLGHVGQSYQITQWYPKPAVYDKDGWHPMPYLDQGEFYSEYGSFDVSITLPENYVVGATGDLRNSEEQQWIDSIANATSKIEKFADHENDNYESSKKLKTLRYTQNNVHDFAWFADKRYHILKGEVELPHSKRKVITYVMFTNAYAEYWKKSIDYVNDAIYYYSLWNGDYAYNQATAVDGALSAGSGMEYPNVTVIGKVSSDRILELVIAHEVGHNWFYGMLGNNERIYPWLDEGVNSYYEQRYLRTKYPDIKLLGNFARTGFAKMLDMDHYPLSYNNYLGYLTTARKNEDQPIQTEAASLTELNIAFIVYAKAEMSLRYLENYLGKETFDRAMQIYFERWKFKHPQPDDLRAVFEEVYEHDLSWFFDWQIKTTEKIDFKIKDVKRFEGQWMAKVENRSLFPAPVFVSALDKNDSIIESFRSDPYTGTQLFFFDHQDIKRITIDAKGIIPEINQRNNSMRVKGIWRKTEPLRLQLLGSIENRNRTQLFFTPVMGFNRYDGPMPGLAIYNHLLPVKNFEYELVPLYGVWAERLNGTGRVAYNWYPFSSFQRITLSTNYSEFTHMYLKTNEGPANIFRYKKIAPKIEFELKKPYARSSQKQTFSLRHVYVEESYKMVYPAFILKSIDVSNYYEIVYQFANMKTMNPYSIKFVAEKGDEEDRSFYKFSLEYKHTLSYKKHNKGIDVRFFGGIGFDDDRNELFSYDGLADYKYDNAYIERNDAYHKQFYVMEGGFKNQVNLQNTKSLMAVNIKIPFPFLLPLGVYGDIATYTDDTNIYDKPVVYDYGIYVPLVRNIAEVYFPLEISTYEKPGPNVIQPPYRERIRVMVNINKLNPFPIIRNNGLN